MITQHNPSEVSCAPCDFSIALHRRRLGDLIDAYMRDPMGEGAATHGANAERIVAGLSGHSSSFVLFLFCGEEIVGLAVCFMNFSTFAAQPYINIHDFFIEQRYRGRGYATILMKEVFSIAERRNCCKVTLEVRADNDAAQALYRKFGFRETDPPMHFWTSPLLPH